MAHRHHQSSILNTITIIQSLLQLYTKWTCAAAIIHLRASRCSAFRWKERFSRSLSGTRYPIFRFRNVIIRGVAWCYFRCRSQMRWHCIFIFHLAGTGGWVLRSMQPSIYRAVTCDLSNSPTILMNIAHCCIIFPSHPSWWCTTLDSLTHFSWWLRQLTTTILLSDMLYNGNSDSVCTSHGLMCGNVSSNSSNV